MTYQTTADVAADAAVAYSVAITAARQLLSSYYFSLVAVATMVAVASSVATMVADADVAVAYSAATTAAQQLSSSYYFFLVVVVTMVMVTAETATTVVVDVAEETVTVDANSIIFA